MATQLTRMHFCFIPLLLHCPESSAEDGTSSEGPRPLLGAWWPVTGLLPAKLYPGGKNQKLKTYYPELLQTDKGHDVYCLVPDTLQVLSACLWTEWENSLVY